MDYLYTDIPIVFRVFFRNRYYHSLAFIGGTGSYDLLYLFSAIAVCLIRYLYT